MISSRHERYMMARHGMGVWGALKGGAKGGLVGAGIGGTYGALTGGIAGPEGVPIGAGVGAAVGGLYGAIHGGVMGHIGERVENSVKNSLKRPDAPKRVNGFYKTKELANHFRREAAMHALEGQFKPEAVHHKRLADYFQAQHDAGNVSTDWDESKHPRGPGGQFTASHGSRRDRYEMRRQGLADSLSGVEPQVPSDAGSRVSVADMAKHHAEKEKQHRKYYEKFSKVQLPGTERHTAHHRALWHRHAETRVALERLARHGKTHVSKDEYQKLASARPQPVAMDMNEREYYEGYFRGKKPSQGHRAEQVRDAIDESVRRRAEAKKAREEHESMMRRTTGNDDQRHEREEFERVMAGRKSGAPSAKRPHRGLHDTLAKELVDFALIGVVLPIALTATLTALAAAGVKAKKWAKNKIKVFTKNRRQAAKAKAIIEAKGGKVEGGSEMSYRMAYGDLRSTRRNAKKASKDVQVPGHSSGNRVDMNPHATTFQVRGGKAKAMARDTRDFAGAGINVRMVQVPGTDFYRVRVSANDKKSLDFVRNWVRQYGAVEIPEGSDQALSFSLGGGMSSRRERYEMRHRGMGFLPPGAARHALARGLMSGGVAGLVSFAVTAGMIKVLRMIGMRKFQRELAQIGWRFESETADKNGGLIKFKRLRPDADVGELKAWIGSKTVTHHVHDVGEGAHATR